MRGVTDPRGGGVGDVCPAPAPRMEVHEVEEPMMHLPCHPKRRPDPRRELRTAIAGPEVLSLGAAGKENRSSRRTLGVRSASRASCPTLAARAAGRRQ